MPSWRPLAGTTLLFAGLGSCRAHTSPEAAAPATPADAATTDRTVSFTEDGAQEGLGFRLYEASPPDAGAATNPLAVATDLSTADTDKLLARVDKLAPVVSDRLPFAMREKSLAPPRTGATELAGFPAAAELAPAATEPGPLKVVRRSPEGDLPVAPNLSVTFSEPMVALSTQAEASSHVPVTLSPDVKGTWRWLGTKTVLFQPDGRFPAATSFTATIAGAKDLRGQALVDTSWTFTTPAPAIERVSHGSVVATALGKGRSAVSVDAGVQPRQPVIAIGFDQRVDPAAMLASLKLSGDVPLRLATAAEIEGDPTAKAWMADKDLAGRVVVVTPTAPLPTGTTFTLKVLAGAPSAEGPRKTSTEQVTRFATYGALSLQETRCSYGATPCPPQSGWYLRFSNPLDAEAFDAASVTIEPAVPGLSFNPTSNYLYVDGDFVGRTTYTLTLPASLKDRFGQTLGAAKSVQLVVGPAERSLVGPPQPFVVTDPAAAPGVSFFTTNSKGLKVRINEVTPDTWADWLAWNQRYRWEDAKRAALPGKTVFSGTVDVAEKPDDQVETRVELAKYLRGKSGRFLVQVEPVEPPKDRWSRQEWIGWVEVSPIGVTAFSDQEDLVVWATDLATGKPLSGASVRQLGGPTQATDAQGLANLKLVSSSAIVVSQGGADVMLVRDPWAYGGGWGPNPPAEQAGWYVFDDKQLYKPGETVHLRGWVRRTPTGKRGDVQALGGDVTLDWTMESSMGNTLGTGKVKLSGLGGFTLDVPLPKTPDLGTATFRFTASGTNVVNPWWAHTVQIEEYRTPEFEVSASAGEGPYALGEDATVDVMAAYYAGGGLPGADVRWSVSATPASFSPPGREDWSFGPYAPWWWFWRGEPTPGAGAAQVLNGKTDATGAHHLGIHFDSMRPARPYTVRAEATVMDVNRQAWTSGQDILVHPSDVYVGLQVDRPWLEKGKRVDVRSIVVDRAGAIRTGVPVELRFARLEWKNAGRGYAETEVEPTTCTLTSADEPGACAFTPNVGGQYRVQARVRDQHGRPNESELRLWVSGAELAPDRGVAQDEVTLLPEKQEYQPGETATFAVQAPFWPAEGTLSVRHAGQLETRAFHMDGSSTELRVPITEEMYPNVVVQVDLVGQKKPDGKPPKVAYATGSLELKVPPLKRKLAVTVAPAVAELEPAGKTSITLTVLDADGKPVKDAELAVVAVDEAVLGLTGYKLPDPMDVFYATRGAGVEDVHLRAWVQLANPDRKRPEGGVEGGNVGGTLGMSGQGFGGGGMDAEMADGAVARAAPMTTLSAAPPPPPAPPGQAPEAKKLEKSRAREENAADDSGATATTPIALRSNFSAVALWSPSVRTDASGKATVPLQVPDSLTRYRVMVVAVAGDKLFGTGEADVTARLPLMVRPSAPRFLNFGDHFELPVVVQNQLDQPLTVDVAVRASNLTIGTGASLGKRVTIPAKDRVEVRFPASADMAGTARFQAVAASGAWADAATVELPVWTPATTEAFATYGVIDTGAIKQPVVAPKDVWPQFGGLTVTTSSTNLQALTDAFLYLVRYPYDCNEQRAARLLGIAGLRDILSAFDAPGVPSKASLEAAVAADLEALKKRQNPDGGWAFWRKNDPSWPYLGIEVTSAITRAEQKGYAVDPEMKARALQYTSTIESRIPGWYSQEAKWMLRAYAISVTGQAGQPQLAKAKALLKEAGVERLPIEGQGYLLPTLATGKATAEVAQIRAFLANRVAESAAGAHFVTNIADGAHVLLQSDRRADGVLLDALVQTDPKSDLIPKIVEGLLAHRRRGAWANTTENAVILLAMDRYFHVYESVTPDFVARAWLGDTYASEHTFKGRTTERSRTDIPMDWLLAHPGDVTLQKDGAGRMYYRLGLDYAPKDLKVPAADYGFTVTRAYAAVDDPGDVRQDPDGTWHVKAGARVRVRLQMVSPMRRYHVALVDPLAAGLEVINPDLATSGMLPSDPATNDKIGGWWWWRTWYEHENLRDDRVEAFTSLLYDGVYDYTYVARATTPGTFVVPPAKAEEMYTPETFGRSAGDKLVVD